MRLPIDSSRLSTEGCRYPVSKGAANSWREGATRQSLGELRSVLPLPQLCTLNQVADYLGISEYTVQRRLKSGDLPGRKRGSRWLVRVVDLAAYVEPEKATGLRWAERDASRLLPTPPRRAEHIRSEVGFKGRPSAPRAR